MKALYYGGNFQALRDSIATESVDLIYLDPPFSSNATYNVGLLEDSERDRMRGRTAACSHKRKTGGAIPYIPIPDHIFSIRASPTKTA